MRPCPFQGLWGRIPQCGLAQTTWSKLGCGAPAGPSLGLCPSPKHRAGSRDRCRALPWARGPGCPGGCGGAASPWLRHPGAMPEGAGPGSLQGGHAPARRQGAPQRGRGGGGLLALPLGAACRSVMTPSAGARLPGQQRWSRSWSGCAGRRRRCRWANPERSVHTGSSALTSRSQREGWGDATLGGFTSLSLSRVCCTPPPRLQYLYLAVAGGPVVTSHAMTS